ncbi:hypothetical protein KZZ52_08140 [Dactylosporangium sp. AC04546]|uniref:hypothetical protein n=1 Tax=Dactylosporangium sp. AC04546 TaxID=2862460 RepID=UPI001EDFAD3B|nr:hypothetical protein [Dactylosporangium sp. AC04546]WVK85349.1 hypothetical protein KZZ52_08140 [Dactylosporangium sp. AC04546]
MRSAFVAVVALLALAGCSFGSGSDGARATPGASASPTGLAASVTGLGIGSYRFSVTANEGKYQGAIDPIAHLLDASVAVSSDGASLKIDTVSVGGLPYTRLTGLPLPGFDGNTWYKVDRARMTKPGALGISAVEDPTGVQALVAATRDVRQNGSGFSGTVDMTRVAAWGPVNIARVLQLGDAAKAVPFEAGVDSQGRLVSMKVSIPDNTVQATYSDFGAPVSVTAPTGAEPLPDHLYGMLGL